MAMATTRTSAARSLPVPHLRVVSNRSYRLSVNEEGAGSWGSSTGTSLTRSPASPAPTGRGAAFERATSGDAEFDISNDGRETFRKVAEVSKSAKECSVVLWRGEVVSV